MPGGRPPSSDRVAAAGAALALLGALLLPFVEFRPNRIASGVAMGVGVAGAWGWTLVGLGALGLAVALLGPPKNRAAALELIAGGMVASLAWALGAAASSLSADAGPIARVSLGAGAWLVLLGSLMMAFAAERGGAPPLVRVGVLVVVSAAIVAAGRVGGLFELSLAKEYAVNSARFWRYVREHLFLAGSGVGLGVLLGIPLGIAATRSRRVGSAVLGVVGVIQTIPSLALLGLLVAPLSALGLGGIGPTPAIIALTLYALLPIVRGTYVGLTSVDPAAIDAGKGMGMGRRQLLARVEAPLAMPLILEGIRLAAILVVGIAAVTAFVGAGGLGVPVFEGLGQQAADLVLLGALPMVVIAVAADILLRFASRAVISPGIRGAER